MNWRWNLYPLRDVDRYSHCQRLLRTRDTVGVVTWSDGHDYHLECLLDRLSSPPLLADCGSSGGLLDYLT